MSIWSDLVTRFKPLDPTTSYSAAMVAAKAATLAAAILEAAIVGTKCSYDIYGITCIKSGGVFLFDKKTPSVRYYVPIYCESRDRVTNAS